MQSQKENSVNTCATKAPNATEVMKCIEDNNQQCIAMQIQAEENCYIQNGNAMNNCKSKSRIQMVARKEVVSDFLENKRQDTRNTRDYNAGVQRREKDGKVMRAYNRHKQGKAVIQGHTYRTDTLQIVMWFLAFVTMFILALQPILQSRSNMTQAGWTSTDGTYYANAPMTVIGGSVDESTHTINDGTKPLYTVSGVNADVLMELLNAVNSSSVWGSKTAPTSGSSVTYLSAKDFGQYGDQSSWADTAKGNAQIVLKLLDTASNPENNVDDAAAQYWQVVYRSTSANEDILTLYMVDQYMTHRFNPSWTSGIYRYEGNYSQSEIRDQAVLPTYQTMTDTYSQLDQYVVAPSDIPGLWQSSAYQTSANDDNQYYNGTASNSGASENGDYALGTSGYGQNNSYYNLENGLDGLSVSKTSDRQWQGDIISAYTDKLWVPSAFEVLHTGYAGEYTTIQDTGRAFDEREGVSYVSSSTSASATLRNVTSGEDGRTGLWELNGYDRAWGDTTNGSWVWLRSGYSGSTGGARGILNSGAHNSNYNVDYTYGVRVALHLNLKSLASNLLASVSAGDTTGEVTITPTSNNIAQTVFQSQGKNVLKNDTSSNGTVEITYNGVNTDTYNFTLNIGGTDITIGTSATSGSIPNYCDYSYTVSGNQVVLTLNNIQQSFNVGGTTALAGFTLTYDATTNGGSTTAQSQMVQEGANVDLSPTATKSGWTFVGWNDNPNATTGLSSFSMPGRATTLYAIFSKEITANFYQINTTSAQPVSVTIYNNATSGQINAPSITTSSGQTAVGWTTTPTSTTSSVNAGASVTISGGETYYAIVRYTVTISYNGNNGSGSTASTQGTAYLTATGTASANTTNAQIQLAQNAFSRPNYTFLGWSTNSGATSAEYTAGQTYPFSTSTILYAVWSKNTSTININITLNVQNSKGIIIYLLNGVENNYTSMTQIVVNSSQTVTLELAKNVTYTIIVSKPYMYNISFSGTGAVVNNSYTFMTADADSTADQSITISGTGNDFNNSLVI